jgi:WD40 repeat protein/tetratricopeptide (TPR) repeat protein
MSGDVSGDASADRTPLRPRQIQFPAPHRRAIKRPEKLKQTSGTFSRPADEVQVIKTDALVSQPAPRPKYEAEEHYEDDDEDTQVASGYESESHNRQIVDAERPSMNRPNIGAEQQSLWKARRAIGFFESGKVGKSMILVQRGLTGESAPEARALFLSLGGYRSLVKGDPSEALSSLQTAVKLLDQCRDLEDFEKADVYYRLADVCEQLRNVVEGLKAINSCVDLLVEIEDAVRLRRAIAAKGRLHYLMRQYEESYQAFEMALSCEGTNPEAWKLHHGIAKCYDKLGLKNEARKAYEASRRSVMSKARDSFDKLVDESGQAPEEEQPAEETVAPRIKSITPSIGNIPSPAAPAISALTANIAGSRAPVSEAYPRDKIFELMKPVAELSPGKSVEPARLAVNAESASEASSEDSTVSIDVFATDPVSSVAQSISRVSRGLVTYLTYAAIPGLVVFFLFGLWFGHSKLSTQLLQVKEKRDELERELGQQLQKRRLDQVALGTAIADAELRANRPGHAAAWAAQAYGRLSQYKNDKSILARRERAASLIEEAFLKGPWSWHSDASAHSSGISTVSVSACGNYVLSLDRGGQLCVWSILTGEQLDLLPGGDAFSKEVHFSPDGKLLACVSKQGRLGIFNWGGRKQGFLVQNLGSKLEKLAFSRAGTRCASLSKGNKIQIWSPQAGSILSNTFDHPAKVLGFAFSKDPRYLVSLCQDKALRVWEPSGKQVSIIEKTHESAILAFAADIDGTQAVSASEDGRIRLWGFFGEKVKKVSDLWIEQKLVQSLALFQGKAGRLLLVGCKNGEIFLYRIAQTWTRLASYRGSSKAVNSLCFLPNGKGVVAGSEDRQVRLWRFNSALETRKTRCYRLPSGIRQIVSGYDRNTVLAVLGQDEMLRLHVVDSNGIRPYSGPLSKELKELITSQAAIALSADQRYLALAKRSKQIIVWDLKKGVKSSEIKIAQTPTAIAIPVSSDHMVVGTSEGELLVVNFEGVILKRSDNGREGVRGAVERLFVGYRSSYVLAVFKNGAVQLWNTSRDQALQQLTGGAKNLPSVAFSHNDQIIAVSSDKSPLRLWSLSPSGELKQRSEWSLSAPVNQLSFSPDGRALALSRGNEVEIRSISSGSVVQHIRDTGQITDLSFVFGPRLLLAGPDGFIKIHDLCGPAFTRRLFEKDPTGYVKTVVGLEINKDNTITRTY